MEYRKLMMEKFKKMKLRQKRTATNDRTESQPDKIKSKRESRKVKDDDEKSSKDIKSEFFNTFSLRSKREKKRKKRERASEGKTKREKKRSMEKKSVLQEEKSTRVRKMKMREVPVTDEQKENYLNFLLEIFGIGVDGILKQFQTDLKTYIPPNISHIAFDKNMNKNRYKDVLCIDETRVVLQVREADYIHANYVRGDPFLNSFICTQAPLQITVNDFWIMILQEKVSNIIMLCNIIEEGKNKCFQYWPQDAGTSLTFGDVQVTCAEVDDNKDTTFILSILQVENTDTRLIIKHIRWKDWPDKGVPSSTLAPFRILKIVRQSLHRATVVHCSAGIGRTGCIVAIEMALQQILSKKPLILVDIVKRLRSMRMSAVQTDEQLVYVVRCLIAYAEACGLFNSKPELQEKADKFSDDYIAMLAAKKAAKERKVVTPSEAEGKKESPQQSIKEALKYVTPINKPETAMLEQMKPQPIQMSEKEKQVQKVGQPLLPSPIPVPQLELPTQTVLSSFPAPPKQFEKLAQPVSPFIAPVQQPPKQFQPQLSPFVAPVQQPPKQFQPQSSPFDAPVQQPPKQFQPQSSPLDAPVQQPPKQFQPQSSPLVTMIQEPYKQIQPLPPPSITTVQQPQKQFQPQSSPLVTMIQEPYKQIQPLPPPSIATVQQPQKQFQPETAASHVPIQKAVASTVSIQQLQKSTPKTEQLIAPLESKPAQIMKLKPVQMPFSSNEPSKTRNV